MKLLGDRCNILAEGLKTAGEELDIEGKILICDTCGACIETCPEKAMELV